MPPSGATRTSLDDFREHLKKLTITPKLHDSNVQEECTFIRALSLKEWLNAETTERGHSVKNVERLLDDACTQAGCHVPPQDYHNIMRYGPLVFCMLLELGVGHLIFELMGYQILDNNVLNYVYVDLRRRISKALDSEDPIVDKIAQGICAKRWTYMPHQFDLAAIKQDVSPPEVLPIAKKQRINDKGATADLHELCIPAEFISTKLKETLSSAYVDPDFGECYLLAVKTYKASPKRREDKVRRLFEGEYAAYSRLSQNSGMVQFLGAFSRSFRDDYTEYNILLEYGECDLAEHFRSHPPVLPDTVQRFWHKLFRIAHALADLHKIVISRRGQEEIYLGWHADIKPDNILLVNGYLKLADPGYAGFAKLIDGQKPVPTKVRALTVTYGAPEFSEGDQEINEPQKADMWSLGCVFSVAATWLILGFPGIAIYTEYRRNALSKRGLNTATNLSDGPQEKDDCFHNGTQVLPEIKQWHDYLRTIIRPTDHVAGTILSVVEQCLLQTSPEERCNADRLCEILKSITQKASSKAIPSPPNDLIETINSIEGRLSLLPAEPRSMSVQDRKKRKTRGFDEPTQDTMHLVHARQADIQPDEGLARLGKLSMENTDLERGSTRNSGTLSRPKQLKRASTTRPHVAQTVFDMHYIHQEPKLGFSLFSRKPKDLLLARNYQNRDIIFIVDNGPSMVTLWNQVTFVLEKLAKTSAWIDDDGIDLEFTNGGKPHKLKDKSIEKDIQKAMRHDDNRPTENHSPGLSKKLKQKLLGWHQTFLNTRNKKTVRNLTLIVLTDGMWSRAEDGVEECIRNFINLLGKIDESSLTTRPVSIQFVAFGDDQYSLNHMKYLDDCLDGNNDIVDTEMWDSDVYKMLLGSFVPQIDQLDAEPEEIDTSASFISNVHSPSESSTYGYGTTRRERFQPNLDVMTHVPRTSTMREEGPQHMQSTTARNISDSSRLLRRSSRREPQEQDRARQGYG